MHKCAEYLENLKRNTLRIHVYALLCAIIRKEEPNEEIINTSITTNTLEHPQFIQEQGVLINPYQVTFINKAKTVSNKPAIEIHFNNFMKVFVYNSITARNNAYDKFVRFIVAK